MYKSPSRSQRSKGIKVKHVLQICLLLAVCFWLIYQVKHSHDKKKEFEEHDRKVSLAAEHSNDLIRLGRKDLKPQLEEGGKKNERHSEEAEEGNAGEEEDEENKLEEEAQVEDNPGEKNNEVRKYRDDTEDEHDEDKFDPEVDREEDVDEDKERESDDNDAEEKNSEDDDSQTENGSASEENDNDGDQSNRHEAREENYKADDASSAVTHDTQTVTSEGENGGLDASNQQFQTDISAKENEVNLTESNTLNNTTEITVNDDETDDRSKNFNTTNEGKSSDDILQKSEDSSVLNSNATEVPNDHQELASKSVEVNNQKTVDSTQSQTVVTTNGEDSAAQTTVLEQGTNSTLPLNNLSDTNSTLTREREDMGSNPVISLNSSVDGGSSMLETQKIDDKNKTSEVKSEDVEAAGSNTSYANDSGDTRQDLIDSSDTSISLDLKDVRTDLETLPAIQTEGSNSEDAAAE